MRAIFLDKDGTLVHDVPYNTDIAKIKLMPHALEGLKQLANHGFKFFIITNQSGLAHGLFNQKDLQRVRRYLEQIFNQEGLVLDDFYYCPHHPKAKRRRYQGPCACRKPKSGLVEQAIAEHGIDPQGSWFIGDILDDVECGHRAGCRSLLIDNGHETQWQINGLRKPDATARHLKEAAEIILAYDQ